MRIQILVTSILALSLAAPPAAAQEPETPVPEAAEPSPGQPAEATEPREIPFLRPSGTYVDLPEMAFDPMTLLTGGAGKPKPFFRLLDAIDGLAGSSSDTVLLDLSRPVGLNLAQVREVERALERVRGAGKKVVCYLENASGTAIQLAALCDRVLMAEMAVADFGSPALQVMHLKDALDLLGVRVDMTRVGEFKGAVEPYVLSEMSAPLREHYHAMLETMNADIVRRVATGRGLAPDRVRALQADRLFRAAAAREAGLVDALVPWEGARRALEQELGTKELELVDAMPKQRRRQRDLFAMLAEMFRSRGDDEEIEDPEIVVLHLSGGIVDGHKAAPGSIVSGPAVEDIDALTKNENVVGVVVRVNSPGGSATASEAVRRALERLAASKPVVFSMGRVAASGGYWITCIGRPILAEAGTITGSIGVFALRMQLGPLMRRIGLRNELVALDEGAAMDAPDRPWSPAAKARIQDFVDGVYDRFVGLVAASREQDEDRVREIAGGRVWSGTQALELDLIDEVGGVDRAVAMIRDEAGAGDDVEVRHLPEPRDFAQLIMEQMFEAQALVEAEPRLRWLLSRAPEVSVLWTLLGEALRPGAPVTAWAMLPQDISIR